MRNEVYDTFKEAFTADYIVMTLGPVEAWFGNRSPPVDKD
jgi:hypothetical protein